MGRGTTTIYMRKENALIAKMEASQLGFSSVEEFLMLLVEVRKKMTWSKLDLECLKQFGQIPKIELLSPEDLEKMGYKEVGIPFTQQLGKVVADVAKPFEQTMKVEVQVKPKKKKEKSKKKKEKLRMPTSEEFFKGTKKEK
jgi:hypothetical protein